MKRLGGYRAGLGWGRQSEADMDTMNGRGLIWDVEDGGCVEDIKVIINHHGLFTNNDMSSGQAHVLFFPSNQGIYRWM